MEVTKQFAQNYLLQQQDALRKWKGLDLSQFPSFRLMPRVDRAVPFYGSARFSALTETEKDALYWSFIQLSVENQILFEQMLLKASRVLRNRVPSDERLQAVQAFAKEEFYHLRAFRQHLDAACYGWWPRSLMCRQNRILKTLFSWLINREPLCVLIPGAKVEIFSLHYGKFLKRCFAGQTNDWVELNLLHSVDEVHHFGFDYALIDSYIRERGLLGRAKVYFFSVLMIISVQLIMLIAANRIVALAMPERKGISLIRYKVGFFTWAVRAFEPYRATRDQLRSIYAKKPFLGSNLFKFTSW